MIVTIIYYQNFKGVFMFTCIDKYIGHILIVYDYTNFILCLHFFRYFMWHLYCNNMTIHLPN